MSKKLLSLLLALAMLFCMVPQAGLGAEIEPETEITETQEPAAVEPAEEKADEEPAPSPAAEPEAPSVEPAPAPATEPEAAPAVQETPETEPAQTDDAEAPADNKTEEEVQEQVTEPAATPSESTEADEGEEEAADTPTDEEEQLAADDTEEITDPDEEVTEPVEDKPADETADTEASEETKDEATEEQPAKEPKEATEEEAPAEAAYVFVPGLAKLTAGTVFADNKCKTELGAVKAEAVVYALERVTGEGDLSGKDIIKITLNMEGAAVEAYVKAARLTMLDDAQAEAYENAQHADAIDYRGTVLDPAAFEAAVAETEEEPADDQQEEEAEPTKEQPEEQPTEQADEPEAESQDETAGEATEDEQADEDAADEEEGDEEAPAEPEAGETFPEADDSEEEAGVEDAESETTEPEAAEAAEDAEGGEEKPEEGKEAEPGEEQPEAVGETEPEDEGEDEADAQEPAADNQQDEEAPDKTPTEETTKPVEETPAEATIYQMVVKLNHDQRIALRRTTDADGDIKGYADNGEIVTVLKTVKNWALVLASLSDAQGYIMTKFLAELPVSEDAKTGDPLGDTIPAETLPVEDEIIVFDETDEIVEVEAADTAAMTIAKDPEDTIVAPNTHATFKVEVDGTVTAYQWQVKTSDTADWTNTKLAGSGYDTDTLRIYATTARNGFRYRCVVTGGGATLTSKDALLTVGNVITITKDPEDTTVAPNTHATFKVEVDGTVTAYQWQVKTSDTADWTNTKLAGSGYDTDTLRIYATTARNGFRYRCVVTGGGTTLTSKDALLTAKVIYEIDNVIYEEIDGVLCVTGYTGTMSSYTVLAEIDGKMVTKIGDSAFEDNTNLESIDLPDTITVIGKRAFAGCTNLREMK